MTADGARRRASSASSSTGGGGAQPLRSRDPDAAAARLESEMAALGALVVATGAARSTSDVAQTALDVLCRATGADAGLVTSTDAAYEAIARVGVEEATIDVIVTYGQLGGPLLRALQAPDAYVSADVATAPLREDVRDAVLRDGIQHLIIVGLRLAGRLTGILALGWRHREPHEPSRALLQQAAALIAASVENARLLGAVESGLKEERRLTRRMRALVELTRLPATSAAGGTGINRLMKDAGAVIGADGLAFGRVDGDDLVLVTADRVVRDEAASLVNRPLDSLPVAAGLRGGALAMLFALDRGPGDHPPTEPDDGTPRIGDPFESVAAFAIREDDRLTGVLFALFRRPLEALELDERTLDAIGRVLDISFANRRLREGIAAGERRYRELFESSPDALLVQSVPEDIVLDANAAAIRLYGDGVVGTPVARLFEEDPMLAGNEVEDPRGFTRYTGTGRRMDGSTFPEEVDLRPIDVGGETRLLAIVRDVTERRQLQAELVQAQKMEAIGLLVAGVAHELNNPLASIVAFSQLIRTDPNLPSDIRRQADLLVQEANRTRVIVQNLLDFARQRPPERTPTNLRPLVDSVLALQSYILSRSSVTVEVDIPADLPALAVDRSQLQQVLINLTFNSAQAIGELGRPGTIRIVARPADAPTGPVVRIEIADDGPGVPTAIVDRLFMPFVTTKEPGHGTGLGLSVSFGIVANHGGSLRHVPSPGPGATFVIELPVEANRAAARPEPPAPSLNSASGRTRSAGEPLEPAESTTSATPAAADRPLPEGQGGTARPEAAATATDLVDGGAGVARKMRVLILDDEPSIRDFLGRVLARSGYEPILATSGRLALEVVSADPPDVILCDHRMAGMNGTEFLAAVMEIAPSLARRFAFMSGDVLNPELRDFAEARGVQLLAKPFDIATVDALVSKLVAADAPG